MHLHTMGRHVLLLSSFLRVQSRLRSQDHLVLFQLVISNDSLSQFGRQIQFQEQKITIPHLLDRSKPLSPLII